MYGGCFLCPLYPVLFLYITSEVKQYYEKLFLSYRPRTECIVFHNFIQIALIQYSGRTKHEWAFSETAKKFSKSPIRPAGCDLWSVWMNINRVTLQHNKEFIMFLFHLVVLYRCVIFKSVWYARMTSWECLNYKKSSQQLPSCVIAMRDSLFCKSFCHYSALSMKRRWKSIRRNRIKQDKEKKKKQGWKIALGHKKCLKLAQILQQSSGTGQVCVSVFFLFWSLYETK